MNAKFFIYGIDESDARQKLLESFEQISVIKCSQHECEKYWKMENVYTFKAEVDLNEENLDSFLNLYANHWMKIGNPVEEYIASSNDVDTTYIRSGFVMIQVFT